MTQRQVQFEESFIKQLNRLWAGGYGSTLYRLYGLGPGSGSNGWDFSKLTQAVNETIDGEWNWEYGREDQGCVFTRQVDPRVLTLYGCSTIKAIKYYIRVSGGCIIEHFDLEAQLDEQEVQGLAMRSFYI